MAADGEVSVPARYSHLLGRVAADVSWQIGPQTRHQKEPQARCISYRRLGCVLAGTADGGRWRRFPAPVSLPGRIIHRESIVARFANLLTQKFLLRSCRLSGVFQSLTAAAKTTCYWLIRPVRGTSCVRRNVIHSRAYRSRRCKSATLRRAS